MTDTALNEARPSLGVGRLLTQAISLTVTHWLTIFLIGAPIYVVSWAIGFVIGATSTIDFETMDFSGVTFDAMTVLIAVSLAVGFFALTYAAIVMIVLKIDGAQRDAPVTTRACVSTTLRVIVPTVLLAMSSSLLVLAGLSFFVVPGLWLVARWWVMVPVIAIEGSGFSGLTRSAALTRGYRWSIVLMTLLFFVLTLLIGIVFSVLRDLLGPAALGTDIVEFCINVGLIASVIQLTHARLVEIKEGISPGGLAEVFE